MQTLSIQIKQFTVINFVLSINRLWTRGVPMDGGKHFTEKTKVVAYVWIYKSVNVLPFENTEITKHIVWVFVFSAVVFQSLLCAEQPIRLFLFIFIQSVCRVSSNTLWGPHSTQYIVHTDNSPCPHSIKKLKSAFLQIVLHRLNIAVFLLLVTVNSGNNLCFCIIFNQHRISRFSWFVFGCFHLCNHYLTIKNK